ncbi:Serine/threonine-protein kinase PknD [Posidoniimonas corsicana]|uniref:Serine/threonine-protein kinase PknD n=1 Tax=Posidoniimonas corsicana TaxID=1938618 RepID=A0A5C5VDM7_9BACT|nr:serine/threonine-protein kinase [Posidoniimonas corsicana]TWT36103.1 Serine/threonine-protein kinase PknD [Posidoniimonas corsicana]
MEASDELDLLFGAAAVELGLLTPDHLADAAAMGNGAALRERLEGLGLLTGEDAARTQQEVERRLAAHGGDSSRAVASLPPDMQCLLDGHLTVAPPATSQDGGPGADPFVTCVSGSREASADQPRRFTILRPHQQGGLGLVSIARDSDFNREVALKEILPASADDQHNRRRFVREAEITGALEHPGVVPVYSLGQYEDGRPYYAMRFIHGADLQQAIDAYRLLPPDKKPLRFRQLLGCFVDVCHTIHYAHSRGVLHRDLKPSNIMLGDYGETLVVDWGLAKASGESHSLDDTGSAPAVELSGNSAAEMTAAGRVIGTPIYMSPEQAAGRHDRIGPATDVYCLGATLYQLLTGAPPFDPNNPNVLAAVRSGIFEPPRKRASDAPKALSAICRKAMALEPGDRYPTCGELGLDVERWLADQPVSAYEEPLSARAWRWVRGHRTLVLSGMTAAVVALVALTLGVLLLSSANQKITAAKDQADLNLQEAVAQRQRAEENAELARQAVRDYYVRVSEESLLDQPGMHPLRNDLLRQALDYYQGFLAESGDDQQLQAEAAAAHYYVGKITEVIDGPEQALEHYDQAAQIQQAQLESAAATDQQAIDYALTLNATGRAYQKLQRPDDAFDLYEQAISIRQQLAEEQPDSAERARELASTVMNVGLLFAGYGDREEALARLQHAQSIRAAHADGEAGAGPLLLRDLGIGSLNTALVLLELQRPEEAAAQLRDAIEQFERAAAAEPNNVADLSRLATCRRVLADIHAARDDVPAAIEQYRAATELMTSLVIRNPEAPAYQLDLAGARMNLGMLLRSINLPDEALAELESAVELLDVPPEESPTPRQRRDLGAAQREAGRLQVELGERDKGLATLRASQETLKSLVREHPGQQEFSSELSKTNEALNEAEESEENAPSEKAA